MHLYTQLLACYYYPRHYRDLNPFAMRPFCASQFTGGLFIHPDWGIKHIQIAKESSFSANHEPVCLVPGFCGRVICVCLIALFNTASTHIMRAFHSADIGVTTNTTSSSAPHALCLRSWPAVRLSASTPQSAADATVVFSAPSMSAALLYCNDGLQDAFQCISSCAQPNTTLLDCMLYL
ncbi:TPA: hypothetical protein ACH3X2_012067 [Trebouxia sp. C0005]